MVHDATHPHVEIYLLTRTRGLDGAVRNAIRDGIDQVVLLGVGYDARAMRLRTPGARFFEVDHPATGTYERARLAELDGYDSDAASDVEREDFVGRLFQTLVETRVGRFLGGAAVPA